MKDLVDELHINEVLENISEAFAHIEWQTWGKAALYLFVGFIIASSASAFISKILSKHTSAHYTLLIRRLFYYGILSLFIIFALTALHLDIKVLGIAGLLTLGIGFASQTAVSNIISGLFLVFERPFVVGDYLELRETLGEIFGEVLSIDLLAIKIRTKDNTYIRIPNETLLKSQFKNVSRFPIRRLDMPIRIAFTEDLERVEKVLHDLATRNPLSLESPAPELLFESFGEFAMQFKFVVWAKQDSYLELKASIPREIQKAFREHLIHIPVPQHMLHFSEKNKASKETLIAEEY